jgi:hypothetical protein
LNNVGEITDSGGGACDYTDQYISGLSYTGSATGDMTVIIDFSCIESGDTCNPPEGTPKTVEFTYGERSYIGGYYQTGAIETGTGPNSVSLTGLFGTSGMALMGVLPLAAAAGFGAVKLNRKKRQ